MMPTDPYTVAAVRSLLVVKPPVPPWWVTTTEGLAGTGPEGRGSPEAAGFFTTRLALMSLLAAGVRPLLLTHAVHTAGEAEEERVLTGIRTCLEAAGLSGLPLEGHRCRGEGSEPVLSVTALGVVDPATFTPGGARPGDEVYMVGHQIDRAEEYLKPNDATIPGFAHLRRLKEAAHDVLPVGNVPMPQAVTALAEAAGLTFRPVPGVPEWLWTRPAGPATCLLAALPRTAVPAVTALPLPVTHIGRLESPAAGD